MNIKRTIRYFKLMYVWNCPNGCVHVCPTDNTRRHTSVQILVLAVHGVKGILAHNMFNMYQPYFTHAHISPLVGEYKLCRYIKVS
jgi:hypothetical protein